MQYSPSVDIARKEKIAKIIATWLKRELRKRNQKVNVEFSVREGYVDLTFVPPPSVFFDEEQKREIRSVMLAPEFKKLALRLLSWKKMRASACPRQVGISEYVWTLAKRP